MPPRNLLERAARLLVPGLALLIAAACTPPALRASAAVLARQGETDYAIVRAADAPETVRLAAGELAEFLGKSTGATFEVVAEPTYDAESGPAIFLGDTQATRAAGFDASALPLGQYRIVSRGEDLHIFGRDTPDGETTAMGGVSAGTLHGVYEFLETQLGVAWLLPGELGEHVPTHETLEIENLDIAGRPYCLYRRAVSHIPKRNEDVEVWFRRQRLGYISQVMAHSHSHPRILPLDHYNAHPEWFPLIEGRRHRQYQVEITNPEVIGMFVQYVCDTFGEDPQMYCHSLSAKDTAFVSESRQMRSGLDNVEGEVGPEIAVSSLMLRFYNAVARGVGPQFPDRMLAGYIYKDHLYPPDGEPELRAEDNLFLMIAPNFDYGFKLASQKTREKFQRVFDYWTGVADRYGYYDLPCNFFPAEVPNPVVPEIVQFIIEKMKQYRFEGVMLYGVDGWINGGPLNYTWARIAWDPDLDARTLLKDYFARLYGPAAGEKINRINEILADGIVEAGGTRYRLAYPHLKEIYAPHWDEIERLFAEAKSLAGTDLHRRRLAELEKFLTISRWMLKMVGLAEDDPASPLDRSGEEVLAMMAEAQGNVYLPPYDLPRFVELPPPAVSVGEAVSPSVEFEEPGPITLRHSARLLLVPHGEEPIGLRIRMDNIQVTPCRVQTLEGETVAEFAIAGRVDLPADRGPLVADIGGGAWYTCWAQNADLGVLTDGSGWIHLMRNRSPVRFVVEDGRESDIQLTLRSSPPTETAEIDVLRPDGTVFASLDTLTATQQSVAIGPDEPAGAWGIRFREPARGVLDDVYLCLDTAGPGAFWWAHGDAHRLDWAVPADMPEAPELSVQIPDVPAAPGGAKGSLRLRGSHRIVLLPEDTEPLPVYLKIRKGTLQAIARDRAGEVIFAGPLTGNAKIVLPSRREGAITLDLHADGMPFYTLAPQRGRWAVQAGHPDGKTPETPAGRIGEQIHLLQSTQPLGLYVCEPGTVRLEVFPAGIREQVAGRILAPDGTELARFDTSPTPRESQVIAFEAPQEGYYRIEWQQPETGSLQDVQLIVREGASAFLCPDREARMAVWFGK